MKEDALLVSARLWTDLSMQGIDSLVGLRLMEGGGLMCHVCHVALPGPS